MRNLCKTLKDREKWKDEDRRNGEIKGRSQSGREQKPTLRKMTVTESLSGPLDQLVFVGAEAALSLEEGTSPTTSSRPKM